MERWQSGWMLWFWKPAWLHGHRGFESLPFRKNRYFLLFKEFENDKSFICSFFPLDFLCLNPTTHWIKTTCIFLPVWKLIYSICWGLCTCIRSRCRSKRLCPKLRGCKSKFIRPQCKLNVSNCRGARVVFFI